MTLERRHRGMLALPALSVLLIAAKTAADATVTEPPIRPQDREHWAFRPPRRVAPPAVRNERWVHNPADRFVLARLEASGLAPLPAADRRTLIRRLTFDLTGLPPHPDQMDAFVHDPSPDAYERLVDRLLASPAYGERWAQHWLDLARYAETDGFEHDNARPNAWRYRDWVIDAFNRDLPYDVFVRFQLAADEFRPDDAAAVVATGFGLCGPDMPDINSQDERRHLVLNDMTATVGAVFLGLQFGCAQCHDHKTDPISQADFYRLRAFFAHADLFGDKPLAPAARRRQLTALQTRYKRLDGERAALMQKARKRLGKDAGVDQDAMLAALDPEQRERFGQLDAALREIRKRQPRELPRARFLSEADADVKPTHLMLRGDFRSPGPVVAPAFPRIANPDDDPFRVPDLAVASSGRRSALAQWLTRPDGLLVTRVIVNRVWQQHFGEGLVRSCNNFGPSGESPSHPALLDWLATELPRRAWSLKQLHRLIVTSATYRQASRPFSSHWTPSERRAAEASWQRGVEADPDNRLLTRQNRRRLDAEAIRDSLLTAAGKLSARRGGPGVMPPLPEEVRRSIRKDHWTVSPDVEDHHRRSIYLFVRRNLQVPFLEVFDRPDTNATCPRRDRSTTAPQALTLLNSALSRDAACGLAGMVMRTSGAEPTAQIDLAYRRTLGRSPDSEERAMALDFLRTQTTRLQAERRDRGSLLLPDALDANADVHQAAALTGFCLSLLNLNEFIYID